MLVEFFIAVGQVRDDSLERVRALSAPKIKIIDDYLERMAERGLVYAQHWLKTQAESQFSPDSQHVLPALAGISAIRTTA